MKRSVSGELLACLSVLAAPAMAGFQVLNWQHTVRAGDAVNPNPDPNAMFPGYDARLAWDSPASAYSLLAIRGNSIFLSARGDDASRTPLTIGAGQQGSVSTDLRFAIDADGPYRLNFSFAGDLNGRSSSGMDANLTFDPDYAGLSLFDYHAESEGDDPHFGFGGNQPIWLAAGE